MQLNLTMASLAQTHSLCLMFGNPDEVVCASVIVHCKKGLRLTFVFVCLVQVAIQYSSGDSCKIPFAVKQCKNTYSIHKKVESQSLSSKFSFIELILTHT